MRLIRLAESARQPWRNGGGWTREIARSPVGSGDEYDWRLSVAEVETDGPFSHFPGCDRILMLLGGSGMELMSAGQPVALHPPNVYLRFPGELPISARLLSGPTTDLNLIWRRDRFTVVMHQALPTSPETVGGAAGVVVVAFSLVTSATRIGDVGEAVLIGADDREVAFVIAPVAGP